jgi:hypothetical protein
MTVGTYEIALLYLLLKLFEGIEGSRQADREALYDAGSVVKVHTLRREAVIAIHARKCLDPPNEGGQFFSARSAAFVFLSPVRAAPLAAVLRDVLHLPSIADFLDEYENLAAEVVVGTPVLPTVGAEVR